LADAGDEAFEGKPVAGDGDVAGIGDVVSDGSVAGECLTDFDSKFGCSVDPACNTEGAVVEAIQ